MIYLIVTEAGMEPEYHSCKCVGDICYFGYTLDVETAMDYISQFGIYKDMKMVPRSKHSIPKDVASILENIQMVDMEDNGNVIMAVSSDEVASMYECMCDDIPEYRDELFTIDDMKRVCKAYKNSEAANKILKLLKSLKDDIAEESTNEVGHTKKWYLYKMRLYGIR